MTDGATHITIGSRRIGPGEPVYCVAELSGNHNGSFQRALDTIAAAAEAGADAIKLQTYTADTLTIRSDRPDFVVPAGSPWSGRTLHELYTEAHTPWAWHPELFAAARRLGLEIFSTPFDDTAVALLESLGSPAQKVASFELVDDALLRTVARTGKPAIVSTGMASLEEIEHAVGVLRGAGARELLVLHCTSAYPAPDDAMKLRSIRALAAVVDAPVGLSDHSMGLVAPVVAVTLGACFIEKHFTLRRADGGVDSEFSLEPAEFAELVRSVRRTEAMLRDEGFGRGVAESGSAVFRRSLYIVEDVAAGGMLTARNLRSIRPGYGLAPRHLDEVLGRRVAQAVERGTPLAWDLLA
jgi:N-acetylneuraminate synthase